LKNPIKSIKKNIKKRKKKEGKLSLFIKKRRKVGWKMTKNIPEKNFFFLKNIFFLFL